MKKDCNNCHYGEFKPQDPRAKHCFTDKNPCFTNPEHPKWKPLTNGDKVRQMTDSDLQELWSTQKFDDKYQPECAKDGRGCQYWNFTCELCPATFRNWLEAEADGQRP